MTELVPFQFETQSIRVLMRGDDLWSVAKDVAQALEYASGTISNIEKTIAHVPEEWKGRYPIPTPGGPQEMWCLSEQGLYFFLARSDKPKALPFQKWLAGEVVPTIRKTGGYHVDPNTITIPKDDYIRLLENRVATLEGRSATPKWGTLLTPEEVVRIRELHAQGYTQRNICEMTGRSKNTVYRVIYGKDRHSGTGEMH